MEHKIRKVDSFDYLLFTPQFFLNNHSDKKQQIFFMLGNSLNSSDGGGFPFTQDFVTLVKTNLKEVDVLTLYLTSIEQIS